MSHITIVWSQSCIELNVIEILLTDQKYFFCNTEVDADWKFESVADMSNRITTVYRKLLPLLLFIKLRNYCGRHYKFIARDGPVTSIWSCYFLHIFKKSYNKFIVKISKLHINCYAKMCD